MIKKTKKEYKKILVISTHCIGDSLLITPITYSLRKAHPESQIDVLVNERGHTAFESNKDINNIIKISRRPKIKEIIDILKREGRYDLVINERTNDRSAFYSLIFGKLRLGVIDHDLPNAWIKKIIYKLSIEEKREFEHKMMRAARLLKKIETPFFAKVVSPEAPLPHEVSSTLPKHYFVIHCPSSNKIKQWPIEHWKTLISALLEKGFYIVLTGAHNEQDMTIIQHILSSFNRHKNILNLAGKLSLAQTSTLIKNSSCFIGPDSGPGHLASGHFVPIISIISVAPASKWAPWPYEYPADIAHPYENKKEFQKKGNILILQSERDCVPCYGSKCKISDAIHSPCLQDISPKRVIEAVELVST